MFVQVQFGSICSEWAEPTETDYVVLQRQEGLLGE